MAAMNTAVSKEYFGALTIRLLVNARADVS